MKGYFSFSSIGNELVINSGALRYNKNIFYEFSILTQYFNQTYSQLITINIDPSSVNKHSLIILYWMLDPLEKNHITKLLLLKSYYFEIIWFSQEHRWKSYKELQQNFMELLLHSTPVNSDNWKPKKISVLVRIMYLKKCLKVSLRPKINSKKSSLSRLTGILPWNFV